jgi:hypothetical protein
MRQVPLEEPGLTTTETSIAGKYNPRRPRNRHINRDDVKIRCHSPRLDALNAKATAQVNTTAKDTSTASDKERPE